VDLVVLEEVIVAPEEDRRVRGVVDQVVRGAEAHTAQEKAGPIHAVPAAEMVDVVILGEVAGRRERLPVAADEVDPAAAHSLHVAADDAVPLAPEHGDGMVPQVAERASDDAALAPARDGNGCAAGGLHPESAERHVRRFG